MAQSFRHVLRGFDAAEVETYVARHRKRWWQGRHLMIKVSGDRIKADRPSTRASQPPVLRGTVRPSSGGALIVGTLHRGASVGIAYTMLCVALLAAGVAAAALSEGAPPWLSVGAVVTAVLFVLVFIGMRVSGVAAQDAEANELKGELDVFFGLRERT